MLTCRKSRPRTIRRWLTFVLVHLPLATGCTSDAEVRQFVDLTFDTAFVVGGTPADTTLLRPLRIRPWVDGVVVIEGAAETRVTAIDASGEVRWTYDRPGQGPGELRIPRDAATTEGGDVFVMDRANAKVIHVSPEGEFVREARLPPVNRLLNGFVKLAPDEFLVMDQTGAGVIFRPWDEGKVARLELDYPASMPERASQMVAVAPGPEPGRWVAGMRFGPSWWFAHEVSSPLRHDLVHAPGYRAHAGMQSVGGGGVQAARYEGDRWFYGAVSISWDGDEIWVLTGGGIAVGDRRNDVLDVYDVEGRYLRSHRFPAEGSFLFHVKTGSRLYLLQLDPVPAIVALDLEA